MASVFSLYNVNITNDPIITNLMTSFEVVKKVREPPLPNWDLDVVLRYLLTDKFEPPGRSSIRNITKRTLFLVSLATAKRVSELHALSKEVGLTNSSTRLLSKN